MPLDHPAIASITEANLQALIDNGVAEGRDIEFKAQSWGAKDEDKREFLADISSFANTLGGHIVVGMQEKNGVAHALVGIGGNPDVERGRLENLVRDGLQPRLRELEVVAVPLANGNNALVLRIPRSWNPPHRVVAHGSTRFYARAGAGKYQPDVDQLRELFAVAPTLAEKIRDFRFDRLAQIKAGATPLGNFPNGALVLHLIPYDAFSRNRRLGVPELREGSSSFPFLGEGILGRFHSPNFRPNLDGLQAVGSMAPPGPTARSYVQLWRTGAVEAACTITFDTTNDSHALPYIPILKLENACIKTVKYYSKGLRALAMEPPWAIFITLLGVRDQRYDVFNWPKRFPVDGRFTEDTVPTSDVAIEAMPDDRQAVARLLRPAFDEIANAAGLDASPTFDENGRWVVKDG